MSVYIRQFSLCNLIKFLERYNTVKVWKMNSRRVRIKKNCCFRSFVVFIDIEQALVFLNTNHLPEWLPGRKLGMSWSPAGRNRPRSPYHGPSVVVLSWTGSLDRLLRQPSNIKVLTSVTAVWFKLHSELLYSSKVSHSEPFIQTAEDARKWKDLKCLLLQMLFCFLVKGWLF